MEFEDGIQRASESVFRHRQFNDVRKIALVYVRRALAFATGSRDLTVHNEKNKTAVRKHRVGKSSGTTNARGAGNNSQPAQDRKAAERASRTAVFKNIMEDSEQAATESLVRFADLQDFSKLASAARRLAKAWDRAATKLERLSDEDI